MVKKTGPPSSSPSSMTKTITLIRVTNFPPIFTLLPALILYLTFQPPPLSIPSVKSNWYVVNMYLHASNDLLDRPNIARYYIYILILYHGRNFDYFVTSNFETLYIYTNWEVAFLLVSALAILRLIYIYIYIIFNMQKCDPAEVRISDFCRSHICWFTIWIYIHICEYIHELFVFT